MKKIGILLCALVSVLSLQAQKYTVTGKVTSGDEELIGVAISSKKNPTTGTITDMNGEYRMQVDGDDTMIFSYIGFSKHEESVKGRNKINVELSEETTMLNELVITVPYGTAKKSTFTGSAGIISSSIVEKSQVSNVSKALQGSVAGLQSFSASGQPGSDATIRIRGVGSVNASSNPLYVVDGVPYEGSLSSISSADIESITVMKDAASATLYGSRAANGVIMITTKQGANDDKPVVSVTSKFGFSSKARKDYDQLNTNQYFELFWEAERNKLMTYPDDPKNPYTLAQANALASKNIVGLLGINPYGTAYPQPVGVDGKIVPGARLLWDDDWDDALSQNAHFTDLNLQVTGGSAKSKYFVSAGYLDDQGIVMESGFKRYTLRTNVTTNVNKWLQVGINVSGTHSIQDYPKQDDTAINNVINFARGLPSFYPIYERKLDTGEYVTDQATGERILDYGSYRATSYKNYNLLGTMPYDKNEIKRDAASARGYVQIEPIKDLTLRTSLNVDYDSKFTHNYVNSKYGPSATTTGGSVYKENVRTTGMTFNNVVNYTKDFNKIHNIRLLGGQEYYEYNNSNFNGERRNMVVSTIMDPIAGAILGGFTGYSDSYKLLSFFGSAEYSLMKRYYLTTSVRTDGSSRFHPDNRWGTFWSVGGSWRIVEEKFMQGIKDKWLTNLSLRSSFGAQGNDNIGYYAYQSLYAIQNNLGEPGLVTSRLETPKLSWETNLNLNIGLDYGFFNNRLSGSIEFFQRKSKDLLFSKEVIPSTGFTSINENIGTIKNYGWEFLVEGYPISTEDWKWKLSVNATTYKNKIVSIPSAEMWNGSKKWVEGGSLYDFYMVEWAGVNPENGNPQWYRYKDGQKIITEDFSSTTSNDKVKSGSSLPDLSGGFSSELSYKGFELSALFAYTIGGKIYNRDKLQLQSHGSPGRTWSTDMLDRWTPDNKYTDVPKLSNKVNSSWTNESTRFLIDRSYLRLKTVTLGYNLPKKWVNPLTLKSMNVFVQAENLLTFTKEQGLDPEQTFDGTTYYRYPAMKTISFGFNVKL